MAHILQAKLIISFLEVQNLYLPEPIQIYEEPSQCLLRHTLCEQCKVQIEPRLVCCGVPYVLAWGEH